MIKVMKRVIKILVCLFVIQTQFVQGQDMQFTQFYSSPVYLNPAFTGANVCSRVSLAYRNQWPGTKRAYQSYLLSVDHYFHKPKLGAGLIMGVDEAGSGNLRTTIINPSFAYEVRINRGFSIRAGFQPGITIKSINFGNLLFGDQLSRGGGLAGAKSITTVETPVQTKAFFDMGAGMLFYTANYWGGFSLSHINQPNESFYELEQKLPMKISVHGGAKFQLNPEEKDLSLKRSISTVVHYRGQNEYDQFDIGLYYSQSMFTMGFWYRGIPGLKAYKPGYSNDDAIAAIIGLQAPRMSVGYSYDVTISKLMGLTQGAHEVTLSFQICDPRKVKVKHALISCPKF